MAQSTLKIYVDSKIAEIILSDDRLRKNAGVISTIKDAIVNYFDHHIDPNDRVGSFLNFIVPGTLSMLIGGWLGPTLGLTMRVLNIDVAAILSNIYDKIKAMVSNGKISSDQVDNVVQAAIQQHGTDDLQSGASVEELINNAKFLKMAVVNYHEGTMDESALKVIFAVSGRKVKALGTIGRLLAWIIKTAAVSAGLMVAGDAANKMLGRPNALDNTIQKGKVIEQAPEVQTPISKQNKFPIKPGYNDLKYNVSNNWIERYPNTDSGIANMLVSFAKEVYSGLDGLEGSIMASPAFKTTVSNISWYNHASSGDSIVFIPKYFTSKKQLVDYFIDDVAAENTSTPSSPSNAPKPNTSNPLAGLSHKDLA